MGKIDPAVAKQMVASYAETRKKLIDQHHGIQDTTSIWFSIDEVKTFMQSLSPTATGVRIYLGAYDKDSTTPNQTTIIAVGTSSAGISSHVDIVGHEAVAPADGDPPYNNGRICPPFC